METVLLGMACVHLLAGLVTLVLGNCPRLLRKVRNISSPASLWPIVPGHVASTDGHTDCVAESPGRLPGAIVGVGKTSGHVQGCEEEQTMNRNVLAAANTRTAPTPDRCPHRRGNLGRGVLRTVALLALIAAPMLLSARGWAATYVVTTVADTENPTDSSLSLRKAILLANATAGLDTILFSIDNTLFGPPPHTIAVGFGDSAGAALPAMTDPVIIDGTSEPDYAGVPVVVVDGSATVAGNGLFVEGGGGGSTIQGLVIKNFFGAGILLYDGNTLIKGNYIGTDASGTLGAGNGGGITMSNVNGNQIIGNVISDNGGHGIMATGDQYTNGDDNLIHGNLIGTDVTGTGKLGNAGDGVSISGSKNTITGNVISGNGGSGVSLYGGPYWWEGGNTVVRNRIGTDKGGTAPLPNAGHGVSITGAFTRLNTIGGFLCRRGEPVNCQANTIAFNKGAGVFVGTATYDLQNFGQAIRGNAIFGNHGMGIDLAPGLYPDGVTPNDPYDDDEGPNGLQNFPNVVAAYTSWIGTTVYLTFDWGLPYGTLYVDFYVNDVSDDVVDGTDPQYIEGQQYVASRSFTGPKPPHSTWVTIPYVPPGKYLTATATDSVGNTSEFSHAVRVVAR